MDGQLVVRELMESCFDFIAMPPLVEKKYRLCEDGRFLSELFSELQRTKYTVLSEAGIFLSELFSELYAYDTYVRLCCTAAVRVRAFMHTSLVFIFCCPPRSYMCLP